MHLASHSEASHPEAGGPSQLQQAGVEATVAAAGHMQPVPLTFNSQAAVYHHCFLLTSTQTAHPEDGRPYQLQQARIATSVMQPQAAPAPALALLFQQLTAQLLSLRF